MTTTLGGLTLPDPLFPTPREQVFVGVHEESHNGTTITDYTNQKWKWTLHFANLTEAQYTTLIAKAQTTSSQSFSPPESASSYTVVVLQDTIRVETIPFGDGATARYMVEFQVEEAA